MTTINKQRRAAVVVFAIGAAIYVVGWGFGHAKNAITMAGLAVQFVGVILMVADMFATWRARRAGPPQRR